MKPPPRSASCRDCERLRRENQHLSRRVSHLEGLLEEARRSAKRQAAPFSKGEPDGTPRWTGRRSGHAYGRKVWGGNLTWRGAQTQQVLASILRTLRRQRRDPYPILERLLRSPQPARLQLVTPGNGPPR